MTVSKPILAALGAIVILLLVGLYGFGGYNYLKDVWTKTLDAYRANIEATYKTAFEEKQKEIDKLTKQITDLKKTNNKLKTEMGVLYGEIDSLNFQLANLKPVENIQQAKKMLEDFGYKVVER